MTETLNARTRPRVDVVSRGLPRAASWLLLVGIGVTAVYPIVTLLFTALRRPHDAPTGAAPPHSLDWSNFSTAWDQARLGQLLPHSVIVTAGAVALIIVCACPAGYVLGCMEFRLKKAFFAVIIVLMVTPPAVLLAPTINVLVSLGLMNSYIGLILVLAGLNVPFAAFMAAAQFATVPSEIIEAARAEGASTLRTFATIALPIVRPTVLAIGVLGMVFCWNELLYAVVVLQDPDKRTVMAGLALLSSQYEIPAPIIASAVTLSAIPIVIVFAIFQRTIVSGLAAGSGK